MNGTFVIYIDESGDEGFSFNQGSSEWFVLSAIIIRKSKENAIVPVMADIRNNLGIEAKKPIHFRDLDNKQKCSYVETIASLDLKTVSILIHKPSLLEPEKFQNRYILYFYAVRFLLERVSWYCRDQKKHPEIGDGSAEIIFSNRSDMSYTELQRYLNKLKIVQDVRIEWSVIKTEQIISFTHGKRVGLQFADAVASSFFNALRYGDIKNGDMCANILKPVVYKHHNIYRGYGIKYWPKEIESLQCFQWLLSDYK